MQPIQINVQVNIGLSSELLTLLSSVINRLRTPVQMLPQAAAPGKEAPAAPQAEVPRPEAGNKPGAEPAPAREPRPEPAGGAPAKPEAYTEVDVRAAMDRTRRRIEGENYKENPDSEGYKKWHRALTSWFKGAATFCGAEKPSALPDSDSRARFIEACDAVQAIGDELVEPEAPF